LNQERLATAPRVRPAAGAGMEAQKKKEHRAGALAAAPRVHPAAGAGMEAQKKEEAGALVAAPRVRPEAGAGMEAQKEEEHRTGALAAAPRVRPAAGAGMEAQKKKEHRAGALAAAPRVLPAAGAGGHREGPPSRFARWLDVLGCVWRYARGFARGVGRVVFLLLGRRSPGTDGVVIERSPDHVAVVKQTGKNHAWMYGKPTVRRRDDPALAAHHDDPAHQDSGTAKALPAPPQPRAPRQLPAPADSPLVMPLACISFSEPGCGLQFELLVVKFCLL